MHVTAMVMTYTWVCELISKLMQAAWFHYFVTEMRLTVAKINDIISMLTNQSEIETEVAR
jgi:hypothetical protein